MRCCLGLSRVRILFAVAGIVVGLVSPAFGQAVRLSLDEAVAKALAGDPGIESSSRDWLTACERADEARWRMMPGVTLSAGYQRLSDLGATSISMEDPFYPFMKGAPETIDFSFPDTLPNYWALAANLQYPVFAGFRIHEAAELARLQADSKAVGIEMLKGALVFEVRRAYWEAVRATRNCDTLRKNLDLMKAGRDLTEQQAAQGTATRADQLAAEARLNQADLDLGDALSVRNRAYLSLASLIRSDEAAKGIVAAPVDTAPPIELSSQPGDALDGGFGPVLDEGDLVGKALARRPESRVSALSLEMGAHGVKQAQASLYPTVTLTGNLTYADPNQRVFFQTDPTIFTLTGSVGVQVGYDLGGLPANLAEIRAQDEALKKMQVDAEKQRDSVVLDVRSCIVSLSRARRDVDLTRRNVDQATENLRVSRQRLANGASNDFDVLTSDFNLLRAEFSVVNREVDVQIASADLARATARDVLK